MSGIINKVKEVVSGDHHETSSTQNAGREFRSNANTGVGSHNVGGAQPTSGTGRTAAGAGGVGGGVSEYGRTADVGSTGLGSAGGRTSEHGSGTAGRTMGGAGGGYSTEASRHTSGPHSSYLANKTDPRVDSDLNRGTYGTTGTTGAGVGGATTGGLGGAGGYGSTNAGPHSSNLANKADPRVDSDLDNRGSLGGAGGYGSTNAGPHSSNLANKVDPRVDSDLDNRGTYGTRGAGAGAVGAGVGGAAAVGNRNAKNTAGPHSSDLANKLDPRVDSDLDGSKTVGRDQTYSRS